MSRIYKNAAELIGSTPLLEADRYKEAAGITARLLVKVEAKNPAGSVKDRVALQMILSAEAEGKLSPGATIIEPTSGNTGIGLCAIAAARGYKAVIVMPDSMSKERILLMKAYGAEVVLTPGSEGMAGCIKKAEELAEKTPGSFIPDQFNNPENPTAHYLTTGPEIFADTDGEIDIFVATFGTGGTVSGVGKYLKEKKTAIKVVAVEPAESPLYTEGRAGSHGIQGIGANFIPATFDSSVPDEVMTVTTADAFEEARRFARTEGLLVGISSGAALKAAALLAVRPENKGKTIVALLPDGGDRYLSSGLYD